MGDGSNIRIWEDPWLRNPLNAYVTSPRLIDTHLSLVFDLMDATHDNWNAQLIHAVFNNVDANNILSMPRPIVVREDQLIWKFSRNGCYTVKSAYYHAMEHLVDSSHLRMDCNWNSIWSLKVPHKLKILLWRIARRCLPTRCRLRHKGVPCQDLCPMCKVPENEWHLFLDVIKHRLFGVRLGYETTLRICLMLRKVPQN